jgi:hypothetical protein
MAAFSVYDYIRRLWKDDQSPVYLVRDKNHELDDYLKTFIIKEWKGGGESGFRGWIGMVKVILIKL